MNIFRKFARLKMLFSLGILALMLPAHSLANPAAESKIQSQNQNSSDVMTAQITVVDKLLFLKERKDKKEPKRMTWEGVLPTDSSERAACKNKCVSGYGVNAMTSTGKPCDDRGYNRCMQLMDWGIFHWHRECKGELKAECDACWRRETQSCYDRSFKRCLDQCPQ